MQLQLPVLLAPAEPELPRGRAVPAARPTTRALRPAPRSSGSAFARVATGVFLVLTASVAAADADEARWVWPTSGSLTSAPTVARGFHPPRQAWSAGHRGVDLVAHEGSLVYSAGAGTVRFAAEVAGRGVVVVGHRDGTRTTYEPVRSTVRVGTVVAAGQQVGVLTGGGTHCLPHHCVHWGRLRGTAYLDPLALVGRGAPARLLPVWTSAADEAVTEIAVTEVTATRGNVRGGAAAAQTAAPRDAEAREPPWALTALGARTPTWLLWVVGTSVAWGLRAAFRRERRARST